MADAHQWEVVELKHWHCADWAHFQSRVMSNSCVHREGLCCDCSHASPIIGPPAVLNTERERERNTYRSDSEKDITVRVRQTPDAGNRGQVYVREKVWRARAEAQWHKLSLGTTGIVSATSWRYQIGARSGF